MIKIDSRKQKIRIWECAYIYTLLGTPIDILLHIIILSANHVHKKQIKNVSECHIKDQNGEMSVSEIADHLGFSHSTVSRGYSANS